MLPSSLIMISGSSIVISVGTLSRVSVNDSGRISSWSSPSSHTLFTITSVSPYLFVYSTVYSVFVDSIVPVVVRPGANVESVPSPSILKVVSE